MVGELKHLYDGFDFKNPQYTTIIDERTKRLVALRKMSTPAIHKLKSFYKFNGLMFIQDWMWTYDPRRQTTTMPFILWQKQREYIEWLDDRVQKKEDGVVEKSRDAGATWLNMAWSIHRWLFSSIKIGFGSRKEQLVDRIGDPDSIFEKGRMILQFLPREFLPSGFKAEDHLCYMKFINPENGSTITGEAGDNIGRGGRNTIYFKDESAFYQHPLLIESSLSQNSDVKIDVSTPNGNGNPFFLKRHSGKYPVFVFDWRDDPRKDDKWYAEQCDKHDPVVIAQEVDRDYSASVEGICIPSKWVKASINFVLQPSGAKRAGLDVADEGADKNALCITHGSVVEHISEWKEGNTTQTTRKAVAICREHGCKQMRYDKVGVGAGIKGESSNEQWHDISFRGINSGSSPTSGMFEPERKNEDMFKNLKAQMWWTMRRRFKKTFEHVTGIKKHQVDDMISIPSDAQLINELSSVKYFITENGKIQMESKDQMARRGVRSPNKADALMLAFAPFGNTAAGVWGSTAESE